MTMSASEHDKMTAPPRLSAPTTPGNAPSEATSTPGSVAWILQNPPAL